MTGVPKAAVAAPVALGVAGLVVGLPVAYALALVLGPLAVVVVVAAARRTAQAVTPLPPLAVHEREGSRREVSEVSWSLVGSRKAISEKALRELRPVARDRLLRLGVDWDEPGGDERAQWMLGPRAWDTLTCPGGTLPDLSDIEHLVATLEALVPRDDVPATSATPATSTTPATSATPAPPAPSPHHPTGRR